MFVDCHTHLEQHSRDELPAILDRALQVGVSAIIIAGTTVESSRQAVLLARQYRALLAGVGIHPMNLNGQLSQTDLDSLNELANDPMTVVMSEIGLDHMREAPDHQVQEDAFRSQINIALEKHLPIIYHTREATSDTLKLLKEEKAFVVGGAAHYFQGDWNNACQVLDMGFYISLAKPLLRLPDLQDVAKRLPLDRIVLETDTYPQMFKRHRKNWTEPRDIRLVAAKLAELHRVDIDDIERRTTVNVRKMLGKQAGRLPHGIE